MNHKNMNDLKLYQCKEELSGSYINIGANDGISDDPLAHFATHPLVQACHRFGFLVRVLLTDVLSAIQLWGYSFGRKPKIMQMDSLSLWSGMIFSPRSDFAVPGQWFGPGN